MSGSGMHRIVILHTNDIHSQLEQLPKIHAYVESLREKVPTEQLILVDIGDHMDRMRLENEGTQGLVNIEAMNLTGYDVIVLGNNEGLTFTHDVLQEQYTKHAQFEIVTSNLLHPDCAESPWMKPYVIIEKTGLRIGFIGVTAAFRVYYELLGWQVVDPLQTVAHYTQVLRDQVDVLIVMSHLGLGLDQQMAHEIEGIDFILGGHTHHLLELPLQIGQTAICAAGKLGHHIGQIALTFDSATKQIHEVQSTMIDLTQAVDHPDMQALLATHRFSSARLLAHEVAYLNEPLSLEWYSESELGNLLAHGLRTWTKADIGVVNSGQLLAGLPASPITRQMLLERCPGPINPCRIHLRGEYLLQALEQSLLDTFQTKQIRGFGFRGEVLGNLCVDGLDIAYDYSRAEMNRIIAVMVNGETLDANREYAIGTIDMFTFGVGYLSLSQGTNIQYFLPEFLRDVLASQLCDPDAIERCKRVNHWHAQT